MSRSIIKNYFRRCECCDYSKKGQISNNRRNRRQARQNLNKDNLDELPLVRKSYFKLFKDFRIPKRKDNVEETAKFLAGFRAKTKKERIALERKYKRKLLSK